MVIHRPVAPQGPFADRAEAGAALAERLRAYGDRRPLIVGLPRGGVVVAAVVARALHADLDVAVVRKIGAPGNPELAIGAAGEGNIVVRNSALVASIGLSDTEFDRRARDAAAEVAERVGRLRRDQSTIPVKGRFVIIVDDGIATGASAEAAVAVMRARGVAEVVVAAPVGSPESVAHLSRAADRVVCVDTPSWLGGVGAWYQDFDPVPEADVVRLLGSAPHAAVQPREVTIRIDHHLVLPGALWEPADS
jgi:putative phosphoribosyl transferase